MDLKQNKLTKKEWESIEIPIAPNELNIIKLIKAGFYNVDIKKNDTLTLLLYLKMENTENIDKYIFINYLQNPLIKILAYSKTNKIGFNILKNKNIHISKADQIRIKNTENQLPHIKDSIYEFIILDLLKSLLKYREKNNKDWYMGYVTIKFMLTNSVTSFNKTLYTIIQNICNTLEDEIEIKEIIYKGYELIEKNPYLLKYKDNQLFDHQKQLFTLFNNNNNNSNLVLYQAPTGTGKTLSPLGLAQKHRIIFLCAARHVGLELARAAIGSSIKVAFAFGCVDSEGIRLHYSAIKDCIRSKKNGTILKVDNSQGQLVELIISDLQSYIPAMHYMCAFNNKENVITYWDEPTISLDYEEHYCHELIYKNWNENIIPNIVLCSATLPNKNDLLDTIHDFKNKFPNSNVSVIKSYNCDKSIQLISKDGNIIIPHKLYDNYKDISRCAENCIENKTLLRYLDLNECIKFIQIINENYKDKINSDKLYLSNYFSDFTNINMLSIKEYYLKLLTNIDITSWGMIKDSLDYVYKRFDSTVLISTKDAHTLTDGPTIFLAEDITKIGKFYLQQANIPSNIINNINKTLQFNNVLNDKIAILTKKLEDLTSQDENNERKMSDIKRGSTEVKQLRVEINNISKLYKKVELPAEYIPNTLEHIDVYANNKKPLDNVFKTSINSEEIEKIMMISDIEDFWKLLLMMGIGVFKLDNSQEYVEIMKQLAYNQKLYLIVASSDFIYGTNYQFCHSYLSNDLKNLTKEKLIQAMGRVGRNKLQQDYTIRFRDKNLIYKLFESESNNLEIHNMRKLFNS